MACPKCNPKKRKSEKTKKRKARPSRATMCPERMADPKLFDRRSFRTVVSGKHRITVGCPKGKWDPVTQRCKVGTRVQRILHPVSEAKCPIPGVKVKRRNPGARWHDAEVGPSLRAAKRATRIGDKLSEQWWEGFGKAHKESARVSREMDINPKSKRWKGILSGRVRKITPVEMRKLNKLGIW